MRSRTEFTSWSSIASAAKASSISGASRLLPIRLVASSPKHRRTKKKCSSSIVIFPRLKRHDKTGPSSVIVASTLMKDCGSGSVDPYELRLTGSHRQRRRRGPDDHLPDVAVE